MLFEKWMLHTKKADFEDIAKKFNINPVLARIIRNRDIVNYEDINAFLNGDIEDMHSPFLLKDMVKAVEIIKNKISVDKKIRIIGDYDIDGICSTYILLSGLEKLGAQVDIDIPDRITDGYGLNISLIEKAYQEGVDTIITCDNGIMANKEVLYAKEKGMTVIITDHHNVPEELPVADAVINPKRKECEYPFKELCGAVVAYKLIQALFIEHKIDSKEYEKYIEFAAIATIGDVVILIGENRIIAKKGLERINTTFNIGLKSLIKVNELDDKKIESYHIGFIIGPCLNASGRLDTAKKALELFRTNDELKACSLANELKTLNTTRKDMTLKGVEEALNIAAENKLDNVLVVYLPECHESLAGIIAGRLREKYYRPVFVLTDSEDGIKGSGRSIDGYNMYDELKKVEDILVKYGGHSMAAGLSLEKSNLEIFSKQLNTNENLSKDELTPKIWIDTALPFEYISEELINELSKLEPFGRGNEKPVFAEKSVRIISAKIVGANKNVITMTLLSNKGYKISGVCFEKDIFEEIQNTVKSQNEVSIIYYPQINEFRGNREIKIHIKRVSH